MKRLYTLLLVVATCLAAFAQTKITVNVDDPAAIRYALDYSDYNYTYFNSEQTSYELTVKGNVVLSANEGYVIDKVMKGDTNLQEYASSTCYIYSSDYSEGDVFEVTTINKNKTVTVTVDDPTHFGSVRIGYYTTYNLPEGESSVTFTTSQDITLSTSTTDWCFGSIKNKAGKELLSGSASTVNVSNADFEDGDELIATTVATPPTNITIVGDAQNVYVTFNGENYYADAQEDGKWYFENVGLSAQFKIAEHNEGRIDAITRQDGETVYFSDGSCSIYTSSLRPGDWTYTVETTDLTPLRTSTFTLVVEGKPENVKLTRKGAYVGIPIDEGENKIKFMESEAPFKVTAVDYYSKPLYAVLLDGEPVEGGGYDGYTLNVVDNSVVTVKTDYPDVDVPMTFVIEGEDLKNGIEFSVDNQNVPYETFTAEGYTVKLGSGVTIRLNSNDYTWELFKVNDREISTTYGGYDNFRVTDEAGYTITIKGKAKEPKVFTVICENWDKVGVYLGTSAYNSNVILLTGEECEIKVPQSQGYLYFGSLPGVEDCVVTGVTCLEYPGAISSWWTNVFQASNVQLGEPCTITLETEIIERPNVFAFYLDPEAEWTYRTLTTGFGGSDIYKRDITASLGYNLIKFDNDYDLPVGLSLYPTPEYMYLNGEQIEVVSPINELNNLDVVKCFLTEPESYKVTYDIADDVKTQVILGVFHDKLTLIEEPAEHQVLAGTQVEVNVYTTYDEAEAPACEIFLNDSEEPLEADENGSYSFLVKADTKLSAKMKVPSGVENVALGEKAEKAVYNLQGVLIYKNATPEQIKALPAGIYVVGGEKKAIR